MKSKTERMESFGERDQQSIQLPKSSMFPSNFWVGRHKIYMWVFPTLLLWQYMFCCK